MKILIVRFSSIGDIVLTTPVIDCIARNLPDAEIHYLTKLKFSGLVENNPHVRRVISIENSTSEVIEDLKKEKYDYVIDLHHNLRTYFLKRKLSVPSISFNKLNVSKWKQVKLKVSMKGSAHVVDRYLATLKALGIQNPEGSVEFNVRKEINVGTDLQLNEPYYTLAIGAQFATKQMPSSKLVYIIDRIAKPVVLVGGEMDSDRANIIISQSNYALIINGCGKFDLEGSASVIKQSKLLITGDTGMMHIASAFELPIISVWGNTIPDFGMFPYRPNRPESFSIHELQNLSCRPCSKIGYQTCPKKHFDCMNKIDYDKIVEEVKAFF